jgi:hypothetical protein
MSPATVWTLACSTSRRTFRQPHPQPLRLRSVKRREHLVELLRGDPQPGVLDRYSHRLRRLLLHLNPHLVRATGGTSQMGDPAMVTSLLSVF